MVVIFSNNLAELKIIHIDPLTLLVDATITETNVPANSKPNFEVCEGANLVPVNGKNVHIEVSN